MRLLQVLDRSELQLPWQGLIDCHALENGGRLLVEADAIRDAYRQEVERHLDALRAAARGPRSDYRLCPSDESPVAVLRSLGKPV